MNRKRPYISPDMDHHTQMSLVCEAAELVDATNELLRLVAELASICRGEGLSLPTDGPAKVLMASLAVLKMQNRISLIIEKVPS